MPDLKGVFVRYMYLANPPQETPVVLHRLLLFNYWSWGKGSILISDGVYRAIGHV